MNGDEVDIWKDKWVSNKRLMGSGSIGERVPQKVAEIIDQVERVWKIEGGKSWARASPGEVSWEEVGFMIGMKELARGIE